MPALLTADEVRQCHAQLGQGWTNVRSKCQALTQHAIQAHTARCREAFLVGSSTSRMQLSAATASRQAMAQPLAFCHQRAFRTTGRPLHRMHKADRAAGVRQPSGQAGKDSVGAQTAAPPVTAGTVRCPQISLPPPHARLV